MSSTLILARHLATRDVITNESGEHVRVLSIHVAPDGHVQINPGWPNAFDLDPDELIPVRRGLPLRSSR